MSSLITPIRLRNRTFLFTLFLIFSLFVGTSATSLQEGKESPGNADKQQDPQWDLPENAKEISDFINDQPVVDMRKIIGDKEQGSWNIPLPETAPKNDGTAVQFSNELIILLPQELKKEQTPTELIFSNSHHDLPKKAHSSAYEEAPQIELADEKPLILEDPDKVVPVSSEKLDPDPIELFEGPDFSSGDGLNDIGEPPTEIPFFEIDLPGDKEDQEPEGPIFDYPENHLDAPVEFFIKAIDEQKEEINEFDHTALIVADIRKYEADFEGESGTFFISYENPDRPGQWIEVPVTVHQDDGLISAEVSYFSNISIGWRPEPPQIKELVDLPDVQPTVREPKEPEKDVPPMKFQPPAEINSLEELAPATAKNKELKKEKEDKEGRAEISAEEDTFITSESLVFLVEAGTFPEKVSLEFEEKSKKQLPNRNDKEDKESTIESDSSQLLHEFKVEVVSQENGKVHHNFEQRVRVGLDVREYGIDLEEMGGTFFIAYRNPSNPNELIDVPIKTYDKTGLISADVTHFSDWVGGWRPEGWTLHWDLPTAGGYNGAANYSYPIEVPPGHNGMQPMVNLSYSSSAINGAMKTVSGGTVAAGWSLNEISVVRTGIKIGSNKLASKPETYRLVLNGAGYELIRKGNEIINVGGATSGIPNSSNGAVYVLKDNPSVRALRFGNDNQPGIVGGTADTPIYWIIQTPDGKSYRLGRYDWSRSEYELHCFCGSTSQALRQKFDSEWHVDTATDAYGNMVAYKRNNSLETDVSGAGSEVTVKTFGSRITSILYNFDDTVWSQPVAGPFTTMGHFSSTKAATEVKFLYASGTPQLEAIEIIHDKQDRPYATHRYDIQTTTLTFANQCTKNLTDPVLTSTKVLWRITEKGRVNSGAWTELPTQRFGYEVMSNFNKPLQTSSGVQIDGNCFNYYRLSEVENGYGATVEFDYESDLRQFDSGVGQYRVTGSGPTEYPKVGTSWYVTEMRVDDGAGHTNKTKYSYEDRCYVQYSTAQSSLTCGYTDLPERPEFGILAGFAKVTTDILEYGSNRVLQRSINRYHQGNLGYGKPWQTESWSSGTNGTLQLFQKTNTYYQDVPIYINNGMMFETLDYTETTNYTIGQTASSHPKIVSRTEHDHTYNTSGFVTNETVKTFTNGALHQTSVTNYLAADTGNNKWWVKRVDKQKVYDGTVSTANLLSETRYLYNTDGVGKVTPTSVSIGAGSDFVTTKTEYDSRGNVDATIDPNLNKTEIVYDQDYKLYPVRVKVLANNSCTFFNVHGFQGPQCNGANSSANNAGLPGLLYVVYDPNNLPTKYKYDVHGRLTETFTPNDTGTPAVTQKYHDFETPFQIETITRDDDSNSPKPMAPKVVQYYDGLGRPIMSEQQGALVGTSSQNLLSLTGYDELGQVVRQTKPILTPTGMTDRFYSYVADTDDFKLAGYRDSFSGTSLDTSEWVSAASTDVSVNRLGIYALNSSTQGYVQRTNPDTKNRSGDDVWGFDFKIQNPGTNTVNLGLRQGSYGNSNYRTLMLTLPYAGNSIQLKQTSGQSGSTPQTYTMVPWQTDSSGFTGWYHAEFKRTANSGIFKITVTQKDNPAINSTLTINAGSTFSSDVWELQFQTLGNGSAVFIDKYYEYITGTDGSIDPEGAKTVYGYTVAGDTLRHPADMTAIAPNGDSSTTLNTITASFNIGGHNRHSQQVVTDPAGQKTAYASNPLGQMALVREHNSNGTTYANTEYEYDAFGNLRFVTRKDANGSQLIKKTEMRYEDDSHPSLKTYMDDPDMGVWEYGYDDLGNLKQQKDANGKYLCFWYNDVNQMIRKSHSPAPCLAPAPATGSTNWLASWTYGTTAPSKGLLTQVNWDGPGGHNKNREFFTYNSLAQLTTHTREIDDVSFTTSYSNYDPLSRPRTMTYPNGQTVTTGFDQMGANSLTEAGAALVNNLNHDINGQLEKIDRSGGRVDTIYTYDVNGRLKQLEHGSSSNAIPNYYFGYFPDGNINNIYEYVSGKHDRTHYEYDHLDRLTRAYTTSTNSIPGLASFDKHFTYDKLGNLKTRTGTGGNTTFYYPTGSTVARPHAVTSATGGQIFGYDNNGNMTDRKDVSGDFAQEWDAENRLEEVRIKSNGEKTTFFYDPSGQRTLTIKPDGTKIYTPFPYHEEEVIPTSTNLISNPGFETTADWTPSPAYPGTGIYRSTGNLADNRSGSYGQGVHNLSYGFLRTVNYINVQANTTYNASVWMRGKIDPDMGSGKYGIAIYFYDSNNNQINATGLYTEGLNNPNWHQYSRSFTTPANTAKVKMYLTFLYADGWINYDDVELVKAGTTSPNLAPDPSFESTGAWEEIKCTCTPNTTFARTSWGVADNRTGAKGYSINNLAYGNVRTANMISVTPGATYDIDMYIRGKMDPDTAAGGYGVAVWYYDANGVYQGFAGLYHYSLNTTAWTTFDRSFTVPAGASKVHIGIIAYNYDGWFNFDDVVLKKQNTSTNLLTNASFDTSSTNGWVKVQNYAGTGFHQTSWGIADNHSGAMGMAISNLEYGFLVNNSQINVTAGDTLELSYWYRGYEDNDTSFGATGFYVDWYDSSGGSLGGSGLYDNANVNSGNWNQFVTTKVVPASAVKARIRLINYNYAGWNNYDDIQVRNITSVSTVKRTTYSIGGTPIAQRISGDPTSANNGLSYIYTDHLGSPTAIANSSNTVLSRQRYYPFGGVRTDSGPDLTNRGYTGHQENRDIGLTYMNARYYAPTTNRWLSPDTIIPDPTNPQAWNRYSYVENNPVNYTDPSGHCIGILAGVDTIVCVGLIAAGGLAIAGVVDVATDGALVDAASDAIGSVSVNVKVRLSNSSWGAMPPERPEGYPLTAPALDEQEGFSIVQEEGTFILQDPFDGALPPPEGFSILPPSPLEILYSEPWEVGPFNDLESSGDGLDRHHAPQAHPAGQVIPGYDRATAPAIAVPKGIHQKIPKTRGAYNGTARDLIAGDMRNLRNSGAPASAVRSLLDLIYQTYPSTTEK